MLPLWSTRSPTVTGVSACWKKVIFLELAALVDAEVISRQPGDKLSVRSGHLDGKQDDFRRHGNFALRGRFERGDSRS